MPDSTRERGTTAIKPATAGRGRASPPDHRPPGEPGLRDRDGAHVVERGEEDVVLLGRAHGDADALTGERPGDDRPRLERRGRLGGALTQREPDEVGLTVGDVDAPLAQRGGEP